MFFSLVYLSFSVNTVLNIMFLCLVKTISYFILLEISTFLGPLRLKHPTENPSLPPPTLLPISPLSSPGQELEAPDASFSLLASHPLCPHSGISLAISLLTFQSLPFTGR